MTMEQPASFFVNTLTFSLNMMDSQEEGGVKNYLFTSSIGVYSQAKFLRRKMCGKHFPQTMINLQVGQSVFVNYNL